MKSVGVGRRSTARGRGVRLKRMCRIFSAQVHVLNNLNSVNDNVQRIAKSIL